MVETLPSPSPSRPDDSIHRRPLRFPLLVIRSFQKTEPRQTNQSRTATQSEYRIQPPGHPAEEELHEANEILTDL